MIRRARLLAVLALVAGGGLLVIAATQTWAEVRLVAGDPLPVPGAAAVPVLAPLGLAVIALGLALTVVGRVFRYVLGVLAVAIGVVLVVLIGRVTLAPSLDAVAGTVTDSTGIAGSGVADLVAGITDTPWPWVGLAASVLVTAAGVLVLATARGWGRTGRRFDAADQLAAQPTAARPHDAVDSWDDLSRGADPTA